MALTAYEIQTRRLLQNPAEPTTLIATADIDSWVNTARGQLAGESEAIRVLGTLTANTGQTAYNFSSINIGSSSVTGIQGVIHVRSMLYAVGTGHQWVTPRPWPYFQLFQMNQPVLFPGAPLVWSQYAQGAAPPGFGGSASGGSFYIDPAPDKPYSLILDCVCYPITLVDDTTPEAIPYLWTDAVPFFAAYYSLLSSSSGARRADAEAYFGYYQQFVQRARAAANPGVNQYQYAQAQDPTMINKLGLSQKAAGGG
jgi:hypothetical protein